MIICYHLKAVTRKVVVKTKIGQRQTTSGVNIDYDDHQYDRFFQVKQRARIPYDICKMSHHLWVTLMLRYCIFCIFLKL